MKARPVLASSRLAQAFAATALMFMLPGHVIAHDAPTVTTEAVTNLTAVSVTLNGTVNPNGTVTTPAFVVNGISYSATPASIPAGGSPVAISLNHPITPGSSYSVYASATNAQGANTGATVDFAAPVPSINWDPGATHAGTEVVSSASAPGGQTGPDFYFKTSSPFGTIPARR